jgi:hypothetical protein
MSANYHKCCFLSQTVVFPFFQTKSPTSNMPHFFFLPRSYIAYFIDWWVEVLGTELMASHLSVIYIPLLLLSFISDKVSWFCPSQPWTAVLLFLPPELLGLQVCAITPSPLFSHKANFLSSLSLFLISPVFLPWLWSPLILSFWLCCLACGRPCPALASNRLMLTCFLSRDSVPAVTSDHFGCFRKRSANNIELCDEKICPLSNSFSNLVKSKKNVSI